MPSHSKDNRPVAEQLRDAWKQLEDKGETPAGGILSHDMAKRLLEESPNEVTGHPDNLDILILDGKEITVLQPGSYTDA